MGRLGRIGVPVERTNLLIALLHSFNPSLPGARR